jgi:membrane associated rhomboid family serine protease
MLSVLIAIVSTVLFFAVPPESMALYPQDPKWWQYLSYGFAHGSTLHLVLNMLALLSFGPAMERTWGGWNFLFNWLLCVALGGLVHCVIADVPVVGASAGLFGLFAAYTISNPSRKVVSIFMLSLPAWAVLSAYVGFSVVAVVIGMDGSIAHGAHIGGAAAGVLCALTTDKKEPR